MSQLKLKISNICQLKDLSLGTPFQFRGKIFMKGVGVKDAMTMNIKFLCWDVFKGEPVDLEEFIEVLELSGEIREPN